MRPVFRRNPTTVSVDALHGLPSQTQSVTFQSDRGPQINLAHQASGNG